MALTIKALPDNEYTTDTPGTYLLETKGKFCENNITIGTNRVIYEINMEYDHSSVRWHFLTQLSSEVMRHIDDPNLIVSCSRLDEFEHEGYDSSICIVSNTSYGSLSDGTPVYGMSSRANKGAEYMTSSGHVFVPANNRLENPLQMKEINGTQYWSYSYFRVDPMGNYYIRGSDGYIHSGMYRLIFQW